MSNLAEIEAVLTASEEQVVDYLVQHPEFFELNDSLLDELMIPHKTEAVSLIEKKLKRLSHLEHERQVLIETLFDNANHNQKLLEHSLAITLSWLSSSDMNELMARTRDELAQRFHVVDVKILTSDDPLMEEIRDIESLRNAIDENRIMCGNLTVDHLVLLLGHDVMDEGSSVLVPLEGYGVMVLMSDKEETFQVDSDTFFLGFLANVWLCASRKILGSMEG